MSFVVGQLVCLSFVVGQFVCLSFIMGQMKSVFVAGLVVCRTLLCNSVFVMRQFLDVTGVWTEKPEKCECVHTEECECVLT